MASIESGAIQIFLDGKPYPFKAGPAQAAALRRLPSPPLDPLHDLYLERPGLAEDVLVRDTDTLEVRDGMRFFSAPKTVLAG
jgi:hypothetical protein